MANGTVYDLTPEKRYRVRKYFTDYYGGHFKAGEIFAFRKRDYLPYHGGTTVHFAEQTLYLQDEVNAEIIDNLWTCLEAFS